MIGFWGVPYRGNFAAMKHPDHLRGHQNDQRFATPKQFV